MMGEYTRNSFRGNASATDPNRTERLLADAEDQISWSEYLHRRRAEDLAAKAATRASAAPSATEAMSLAPSAAPPVDSVAKTLASYCRAKSLPVDVSTWDAEELQGLEASELVLLDFTPVQAVRLASKVRGLLRVGGEVRR